MPVLHQETDPVFFWLDGKGLGNLQRFNTTDVQFVTTRCTIVFSKLSYEDQRRLLCQTCRDRKLVISDSFLTHDRLQVARSVANGQEMQLSAVTATAQPSSDGDFLSHMLPSCINHHDRHQHI